jgi:hypothetical protein
VAIIPNILIARHFAGEDDKEKICGSRRIRTVLIVTKLVGIASCIALLIVNLPHTSLAKTTIATDQPNQVTTSRLFLTTTSPYQVISVVVNLQVLDFILLAYSIINIIMDSVGILCNFIMIIITSLGGPRSLCK